MNRPTDWFVQNWREALEKISEIQKLDNQFEDKDGIVEKAKKSLQVEDEELKKRINWLRCMQRQQGYLEKKSIRKL